MTRLSNAPVQRVTSVRFDKPLMDRLVAIAERETQGNVAALIRAMVVADLARRERQERRRAKAEAA